MVGRVKVGLAIIIGAVPWSISGGGKKIDRYIDRFLVEKTQRTNERTNL